MHARTRSLLLAPALPISSFFRSQLRRTYMQCSENFRNVCVYVLYERTRPSAAAPSIDRERAACGKIFGLGKKWPCTTLRLLAILSVYVYCERNTPRVRNTPRSLYYSRARVYLCIYIYMYIYINSHFFFILFSLMRALYNRSHNVADNDWTAYTPTWDAFNLWNLLVFHIGSSSQERSEEGGSRIVNSASALVWQKYQLRRGGVKGAANWA